MTNQEIISVTNLTKKFGDKEVLRIDQLAFRKGKITGIVGPSGAGKSTLLRILNALESPTTGEVTYFGQKTRKSRTDNLALQRNMTMVFQKPVLFDMSVYDNVAFGLRARNMTNKEIENRVCSVLETIGMGTQSQQRAKTLSGGEAQRVAFARALVLRPEILLLDEPTANLDPANVELLESIVSSANSEAAMSVLIVTHNLLQARRLAHDAAFFYQGRLIESGEATQIFQAPVHESTRMFVEGKMIY